MLNPKASHNFTFRCLHSNPVNYFSSLLNIYLRRLIYWFFTRKRAKKYKEDIIEFYFKHNYNFLFEQNHN